MIRGNERAIELGLDVLATVKRRRAQPTLEEIVAFINAAREVIGGSSIAVSKQDIWYLEHRALQKLRLRSHARSLQQFAERLIA